KSYADTVKELRLNDNIEDRRYRITFHTLRHTYATRLAEAGCPLTVLRDLLGHRDLIMVSRYAKSTLEQAAARVNDL
ncbi:MAG TPA: site-specific integrase, partial [Hellea balneolensis]|nr:site-specific integrase [Hellea balneolensis]